MTKQNDSGYVTAYNIHKMLLAEGVERKPQMMYNYIKNNLIPSVEVNGQKLVKIQDAVVFVDKFVQKHGVKA